MVYNYIRSSCTKMTNIVIMLLRLISNDLKITIQWKQGSSPILNKHDKVSFSSLVFWWIDKIRLISAMLQYCSSMIHEIFYRSNGTIKYYTDKTSYNLICINVITTFVAKIVYNLNFKTCFAKNCFEICAWNGVRHVF